MSSKPGTLFEWAAGSSYVTEPSAGQKDAGIPPGSQLPAHWFNWLLNNLESWVAYLNDPNAITIGASMLSSIANAHAARLTVDPAAHGTAHYTLIASFGDARLYIGSSTKLALVLTFNAVSDASNTWAKITNSQAATAFYITRTGIRVASMPLAQNTAWTDAFVVGEGTTSGWGTRQLWGADTESETNAESDSPDQFIQAPSTSGTDRKLLLHIKRASSGDIRVYYLTAGAGGLEITINAGWTNSTDLWALDLASTAMKFSIAEGQILLRRKNSGSAASTFNDSSWDSTPLNFVPQSASGTGTSDDNIVGLGNGHIKFSNTATDDADDANPPAQTSHANKVSPRNVDKVTAYFNSLAAADGNITPLSGYNLSSAADAISQSGDVITVKFGTALQSANYEAVVTLDFSSTSDFYTPQIISKSTTQITMRAFKSTVASPCVTSVADLNTVTIGFNLRISGRQDT